MSDPEQSHRDEPPLRADECDVRCGCGSLLARYVAGGVELKCRHCKQTRILPLSEPPSG